MLFATVINWLVLLSVLMVYAKRLDPYLHILLFDSNVYS